MMNEFEARYPTPEEIDQHIRNGHRMRSAAMREMIQAMARAIKPKRREAAAAKPAAKKGVAHA